MNADDTYIQVGTYRTHNDDKGFREVKKNIAPTITARAREDGSGMPVIRQLSRGKNKGADLTTCPTISSNAFQENNLIDGVRRFTEIECERLQGFPDNWTQYGNYNGRIRRISKTKRYKLIGNAVTVDIVELIAKRLKFIDNETKKDRSIYFERGDKVRIINLNKEGIIISIAYISYEYLSYNVEVCGSTVVVDIKNLEKI